MICKACGSEWWVDQKIIKPADVFRDQAVPNHQHVATETRYRLICADCGAEQLQENSHG